MIDLFDYLLDEENTEKKKRLYICPEFILLEFYFMLDAFKDIVILVTLFFINTWLYRNFVNTLKLYYYVVRLLSHVCEIIREKKKESLETF